MNGIFQINGIAYHDQLSSIADQAASRGNMNGIAHIDDFAFHHRQPSMADRSDSTKAHAFDEEPEVLEPIAIIGMSHKFPQEAVDNESFWTMLVNQRCASTEFPRNRLNIDAFYDPDPKKQNRVRSRLCTFLDCS